MVIGDDIVAQWPTNIINISQINKASNLVLCLETSAKKKYIFKPAIGEKPLWDFPSGTLWKREFLAAHVLASFNVGTPVTKLVMKSPVGAGVLIDWVDGHSSENELAEITSKEDKRDTTWLLSIKGENQLGQPAWLWHRNDQSLRRIALVDLVINNADRKASHILTCGSSFIPIDHGLCFHQDLKLRTVFWGWAGEAFTPEEIARISEFRQGINSQWYRTYVTDSEIESLILRCDNLLEERSFPHPNVNSAVLPWPIF